MPDRVNIWPIRMFFIGPLLRVPNAFRGQILDFFRSSDMFLLAQVGLVCLIELQKLWKLKQYRDSPLSTGRPCGYIPVNFWYRAFLMVPELGFWTVLEGLITNQISYLLDNLYPLLQLAKVLYSQIRISSIYLTQTVYTLVNFLSSSLIRALRSEITTKVFQVTWNTILCLPKVPYRLSGYFFDIG